jgi:hypothetical protein
MCSAWSVYQQCNSLHATTYTPDDGPCETDTCRVVVEERHELLGVVKLGTTRRAALNGTEHCLCTYIKEAMTAGVLQMRPLVHATRLGNKDTNKYAHTISFFILPLMA